MALGLAGLFLGLYRLLARQDPCLGPFFVVWGSLAIILTGIRFQRTLIWFEWFDDTLRYKRACRSTIRELPLSEIVKLQPLVRPRRSIPYGFEILCRDGSRLNVEYDTLDAAIGLERMLNARLDRSNNQP
jgi:hypothetical protein